MNQNIMNKKNVICRLTIPLKIIDSKIKMELHMTAMVWNAPVLLMFLFVCSVFSHSRTISITRDELLDIRPFFVYSDALLDVLVRGAAVLSQMRAQMEKRADYITKLMGKTRGGALCF